MTKPTQKLIYWNKKQLAFLQAKQKIRCNLWGRGTGKSTAIAGNERDKITTLPRGKSFFSSTTYNQILTKTLPAIENKWQELGLIEDIHYVVGKKPPKWFTKPYSSPRKYQNVISFWNGYCIEFLSMDRPDLARGGSYDGGQIDEAALVKKEHINKILIPSVRGNLHRFNHHLHQNVNLYSSVPWKPSGYYLFDYEEKALAQPDKYFFSEATAYDNIEIIGMEGIKRMEEELSYLEFLVEVKNQRITRIPDCFYHKLNDAKHGYSTNYDYGEGDRGITVKGDKETHREKLLDVSFDFSGWFNCMTVWQERNNVEYLLRAIHVKEDKKLNELVDKFCSIYKTHKLKYVRVWGEPRGHDRRADGPTLYDKIQERFQMHGWECEIRAHAGRTTNHEQRYTFVNNILSEQYSYLPSVRINQERAKDVIIACGATGVTTEFKKDKSKEKDRNFPQEHAPHYTDTLDYYLVQKHGHKEDLASDLDIAGEASFY